MSNDHSIHFTLREGKGGRLLYELPMEAIDLVDPEQLDELKKSHPFFFPCINITLKEDAVVFTYQKEAGYMNIETVKNQDYELLKKFALQLIELDHLIGTQYTTNLHPNNLFINSEGNLKIAHRGIRNVFPDQVMSKARLVIDIRDILLYLFSDLSFEEIKENQLRLQNPFHVRLQQSKTLDDLRKVLVQADEKPIQEKEQRKGKLASTKETPKEKNQPIQRRSLLTGALGGLIIGMLVIYLFQVVPLNNTYSEEVASAEKGADDETTEEQDHSSLDYEDQVKALDAYRALSQGEIAEAVTYLEQAEELEEAEKDLLFEIYLEEGTMEDFSKALELGGAYEVEAIQELINLGTKEAKALINSWHPTSDEGKIEQVFFQREFEAVIELAEKIPTNRATYLAARSYLKLEMPEEARALGEELENKELQITSLELESDLIEENEDEDDKEVKEKLEEIEEAIDDLK